MSVWKWVVPCAVAFALVAPAAHADPSDDPALEQTVGADETIAPLGTATVIREGHADLGPLLIDGELDFLVRDDSADTPVWRHLDDVVFVLDEAAAQTLPDSGDYDFTGVSAGGTVYAVPQTQVQGVPWLGWSTQSPEVTRAVSRGITLEYEGHQGPGTFTVFVQSSGFGKPQQLWSSQSPERQSIWVDLKTHAHANWVFSDPGVHLVRVGITAKMIDGTEKSVSKVLRFAVAGASTDEAATAQWSNPVPQASPSSGQVVKDHAAQTSRTVSRVTVGLFAATAILLAAALVRRIRGSRARAHAQRGVEHE